MTNSENIHNTCDPRCFQHHPGCPYWPHGQYATCCNCLNGSNDNQGEDSTSSDTYDKSTIDDMLDQLREKDAELDKLLTDLSNKLTTDGIGKDEIVALIANAVLNISIPQHYVTYQELELYLENFNPEGGSGEGSGEDSGSGNISIDTTKVVMMDGGKIGLNYKNSKLSLVTTPPTANVHVALRVNPAIIEHGVPTSVTITVDGDLSSFKRAVLRSDNGLEEIDMKNSPVYRDATASTTNDTTYTLTYVDQDDNILETSSTVRIGYRVLYGDVQPTESLFSSVDALLEYDGYQGIYTSNPKSLSIEQRNGRYGWIATPFKIKAVYDTSLSDMGGWLADNDYKLKYSVVNSPYSGTGMYYVYRTYNAGLGDVTWNIISE